MSMITKNLLEKLYILIIVFISISPIYSQTKDKDFVLVLDAGHGGHEPGAKGIYDYEKNITLDITLLLGKKIEKHFDDVKVIYTRKDDTFVTLAGRANIANKNDADFFISIHCNSHRPTANGTETYVLGTEDYRSRDNMSVVKKENSVILLEDNHEEVYEGFDPSKPESFIGLTLMQNVHLENSLLFAKAVEDNFINKNHRKSRGVKQAGFAVLWRTATPSVLIETGFITHPTEGKYLASKKGKEETAESIFEAFKFYKREWDKKNRNEEGANETIKKVVETPKVEKPVEGKYFKIQFLTSTKKYKENAIQLKGLKPVEVIESNGIYKYYYGKTSFLTKSESLLDYVKRKGFPDAFSVAFDIKSSQPTTNETNNEKIINNKKQETGYRIQILTSKRKYKNNAPQLKGLSPIDRIDKDNLFKYYYGWFDNESNAKKALPKVKKSGFKDAFIVEFVDGKKK